MEVVRCLPAKMLIQRNLPHRRLNQIGAADDLGDPLKVVIDHHRQVVGKQSVATVDNKIFSRQRLVGDQRAAQAVGELQNRMGLAQTQRGVFRPQPKVAAVTIIDPAYGVDTRAGAGAVVAQPLLAQPGQRLAVGFVPLRLPEYLAVPVQTVVVELAQDGVGGPGDFARRVDIFNTNAPDTLVRAGLQVAAERGDQRAEVEFAGGEGAKRPI